MEIETSALSLSRRRDCLFAFGAGAVLFILACTAGKEIFALGRISITSLVLSVLASAAAAGTAAGFLPLDKLPKAVGLPLAGKVGSRTALMTAFLASGMCVMGVHVSGSAIPYLLWLPGLLSIMPGALAGIVAAALVANAQKDGGDDAPNASLVEVPGGGLWELGVIALGIFGLLSPFFLPSGIPKPAPVISRPQIVAEAPVVPLPVPKADPPVPPPPPFEFKPDPELSKSPPECWTLAKVQVIPDVDGSDDAPVALSPDGRSFVCVKAGSEGKAMQLISLLTLKNERTWRLGDVVNQVCFSPDGTKLFFVRAGNAPGLTVAQADRSLVELPVAEPGPPSNAVVTWPRETEVAFHRAGEPTVVLNLETLLMDQSEKRESQQKFSEGTTWRFTDKPLYLSATMPPPTGNLVTWPVARVTRLAVENPVDGTARIFTEPELIAGDRLLASPDGSTLIRLNRGGTFVYYYDRREPRALDYEVTMPHDPSKFPEDSPLRDAGNRNKLWVMAYPPLLNPLTGKSVGPDRRQILGRARVLSWEGIKAHIRLFEVIDPLPPTSVFADPHLERESAVELIDLLVPHRWWTSAGEPLSGKTFTPAAPPKLNFSGSISLTSHRGAFTVQAVSPKPVSPKSTVNPAPPPSTMPPPGVNNVETQIRAFVRTHHEKASRGDWRAESADYDQRVNYFEHGIITREAVEKDQKYYHSQYDTEETVTEPISIREAGNDSFAVSYTLVSNLKEFGKPPTTKRSEVRLTIRNTAAGWRISAHNPKK